MLNSRDNADPFGNPNVSRVIVGGTIDQSGVDTIGIAQSIDPGNFGREEQALVLLDIVSDPTDDDASFNAYMDDSSDRIKFVGTHWATSCRTRSVTTWAASTSTSSTTCST